MAMGGQTQKEIESFADINKSLPLLLCNGGIIA